MNRHKIGLAARWKSQMLVPLNKPIQPVRLLLVRPLQFEQVRILITGRWQLPIMQTLGEMPLWYG
jgi:hypothetical protein